jgi:uncharacterized repeat protein (TIGR01451 family)
MRLSTLASLFMLSMIPVHVLAQGQTCATAAVAAPDIIHQVQTTWGGDGYDGECFFSQGLSPQGLWYQYLATYTGPVEITSCLPGTDSDTRLAVMTGTCGSLTCIAYNDDDQSCGDTLSFSSTVNFEQVAGQLYYIQWDNMFMGNATVEFEWIINTCESSVSGASFRDLNSNGIQDEDEPGFDVLIARNGVPVAYASGGQYSLCSPFGQHELSISNPSPYFTIIPPTHTYTTTAMDNSVGGLDFIFQPIPGMVDGSVALWAAAPPWIGNTTSMYIQYENLATEPFAASLQLQLDPQLEFSSASVTATSIQGNTISWDLGTVPVATTETIVVQIFTPINATAGMETTSSVSLNVQTTDLDTTNNMVELTAEIVAAYDPNDKQVSLSTITPEQVLGKQILNYTIRFQNTGTAPAVNVVIRDTLFDNLDLSTFEMIGATHHQVIDINGREIVWTFPGIMLPDSTTDFDASIGVLHFKVAVNDDLQLGDEIHNDAYIYFDYADPILTNTVVTTVALPTGISSTSAAQDLLLVYPSPTSGPLNIRWLGQPSADEVQMTITDALGRTVLHQQVNALQHAQDIAIDLSALPQGHYHIRLMGPRMNTVARVVVHR